MTYELRSKSGRGSRGGAVPRAPVRHGAGAARSDVGQSCERQGDGTGACLRSADAEHAAAGGHGGPSAASATRPRGADAVQSTNGVDAGDARVDGAAPRDPAGGARGPPTSGETGRASSDHSGVEYGMIGRHSRIKCILFHVLRRMATMMIAVFILSLLAVLAEQIMLTKLAVPVGAQTVGAAQLMLAADSVELAYARCSTDARCRTAFYLGTAADTEYARRTFSHLYTQWMTARADLLSTDLALLLLQQQQPGEASSSTPESSLSPSSSSSPSSAVAWSFLLYEMSEASFCAPGEEFVLDAGCRCQSGAHCPGRVAADGVSSRTRNDAFVYVLLGALLAVLVLIGVPLLSKQLHLEQTIEQLLGRQHQD